VGEFCESILERLFRLDYRLYKLGVISQKRLEIEFKLLLNANDSHVCRIDWHNNG